MNKGYIAIATVLILSVVVITIGITVSLLAIGEGQSSLSLTKGEQTLTLVEGCVEDGLLGIRNSPSYTGGTITRPEGSCSVSVSRAGNVYTVTVSTTGTYIRSVQAVVTRTNPLSITSWKEQ